METGTVGYNEKKKIYSFKKASIKQFFDIFKAALTEGDPQVLSQLFATPCFVLGDEMTRVVQSPQEVLEFFGGAKEEYNKMGITETRADIEGTDWITEKIVIVEVRWPHLDKQGKEHGSEASSYILRLDGNGDLKIQAVVMHGVSTSH
ncbi:MAG: hypothetical protein AB7F59_03505 [Bdellovibrionales bacterium]